VGEMSRRYDLNEQDDIFAGGDENVLRDLANAATVLAFGRKMAWR